jgi:hypothetical protein
MRFRGWSSSAGRDIRLSSGPIAQRLEQGTHNPLVPGSNPGGPNSNFRFGLGGFRKGENGKSKRQFLKTNIGLVIFVRRYQRSPVLGQLKQLLGSSRRKPLRSATIGLLSSSLGRGRFNDDAFAARIGPQCASPGFSFRRASHIASVITARKPRWLVPVSGSPLPRPPGM